MAHTSRAAAPHGDRAQVLDARLPDDLVLEALALARRVNDRLKDHTPLPAPCLRTVPEDEESYHPGELVV